MTKVLILGAGGQVAGHVIEKLSQNNSIRLTLYLRNASHLQHLEGGQIKLIEGDILDGEKLENAMQGQDLVYVNINGQEDVIAEQTVKAMQTAGVKRIVFIAAIGIYDEVPGAFGLWNKQMIGPILERYQKAASLIEASGLVYTILRPTWYTNKDEVEYTITQKGQPVTGTEISRKSVADLVVKLIEDPNLHVNESLGMEKAGTEADKPGFMN
ncbi:NAD(P)H-binding protein [Mucilaginibacter sp. BJC16-A38]|uniref:NAD(P)H-binding protein n=1 Tax=Mucilaginibacter phenanthrenivorans TaxID=1234842 RepID=UPI002157CECB|nr:NAD(P)H-binding protein [Mucilaginibacter phenanthrenivorans]MCR8560042.1 NAD(P)H-binding protein [Mucilaginibacter phenanthrenivorans]